MEQLVEVNTIISEVEKEDSTTCTNAGMTKLDGEEENMIPKPQSPKENMTYEEEESLDLATPRIEMGSSDVSSTPRKVGFAHYVHHKEKRYW
jgi:hypothetical protein